MQPETEQIFATLELLLDQSLPFELPGHEDGGHIYPFVWDGSKQEEFNVLSLCHANGWLKLTDVDATIKDWQEMNYAKHFPDFSLDSKRKNALIHQFESLFQVLNSNLDNLESYIFNSGYSFGSNPSVILGKTKDEDWICISPTVYTETTISQQQISRSSIPKQTLQSLGKNTLAILAQIQPISSEIGITSLNGDLGGGYMYDYAHQIVYAAATKELALAGVLRASGTLEIAHFNGFFSDRKYLEDWYFDYDINEISQKYENINQFFSQAFPKVVMYRFSFWTQENIYTIGQTRKGDWAGIHINSEFVYNP